MKFVWMATVLYFLVWFIGLFTVGEVIWYIMTGTIDFITVALSCVVVMILTRDTKPSR